MTYIQKCIFILCLHEFGYFEICATYKQNSNRGIQSKKPLLIILAVSNVIIDDGLLHGGSNSICPALVRIHMYC